MDICTSPELLSSFRGTIWSPSLTPKGYKFGSVKAGVSLTAGEKQSEMKRINRLMVITWKSSSVQL